jgi:hypothetical protein
MSLLDSSGVKGAHYFMYIIQYSPLDGRMHLMESRGLPAPVLLDRVGETVWTDDMMDDQVSSIQRHGPDQRLSGS